MATEQTPSALLARVTTNSDFLRANGRPANQEWIKVSKTGRISIAHDISKATRFTTHEDAAAAVATRQAYEAAKLGISANDPDNTWEVVAA